MSDSRLIVGLGNPGRDYVDTRHNAGFIVLDALAEQASAVWKNASKFEAQVAQTCLSGRKVWLCKPQTYMNLSGRSVGRLCGFYKIPPAMTLVVVDDANLPFGRVRMKANGSSGGHHGLESVEGALGSQEFARQRIGIGREPGQRELRSHVLGRFDETERGPLAKVVEQCVRQIVCWAVDGAGPAMNQFNGVVAFDPA